VDAGAKTAAKVLASGLSMMVYPGGASTAFTCILHVIMITTLLPAAAATAHQTRQLLIIFMMIMMLLVAVQA